MENYYDIDTKEIMQKLNSTENGLSPEEAQAKLQKIGPNSIITKPKESIIFKFFKEFKNLMIIILLLASLFSFVLSLINHEPIIDSIIILAIVIINAFLGFIQELKADKSLAELSKMQVTYTKVKRDNQMCLIESKYLVPGDIIYLEAGDIVPADCRLITSYSLKVDESSLTGESIAVEKDGETIHKKTSNPSNMIYLGTNVTYGKCQAIVCSTGMNTNFGKIAQSLNTETKEITPLERQINNIAKTLTFIISIIIIIMFIIGLIKGLDLFEIILLSISLAIAAIPEGLPAIITITLSLGVNSLAKKKAIIRKMTSVETLGCTQIICTDKTGTLTQNKMQVINVYANNQILNPNDLDKDNILFKIMALNNDVEKNKTKYIGESSEIALYTCSEKYLNINKLRKDYERIDEIPFDSERKMMSTINQNSKDTFLFTKGSFDSLIKICTHMLINGKKTKLTKSLTENLKQVVKEESSKGYRLLAFAYKPLSKNYELKSAENDLIFVGLTMMIDPPRKDVKNAIQTCLKANIKPIMITGDSIDTAISIAKELGILKNEDEAITGEQLNQLSPEMLSQNIEKYTVYARVSPLDKLKIIDAWQHQNKVVAMTGDGVNDAPALKKADIGIGMGITGTEVSKNTSDIILADDSFSTIISAIKEGRRIYENIKNVLVYLLVGNLAEILIVFLGMIFGLEIFIPIQLLYINLITDSIPAIALAFEAEPQNIMQNKIRKKDESIFTPYLIAKIITSSLLKATAILFVYFVNLTLFDAQTATSCAFLSLIISEIIYAYSCRNINDNILNKSLFKNHYLNKSILFLIIIQILIFTTPLKHIFKISNVNIIQVLYCLSIVLLTLIIDELLKKSISKRFKESY